MMIVIAIFLIMFFIVSTKRLDWSMMLILAGLPLYLVRFKVLGVPLTMLEAMILIIFFVWLERNYKQLYRNISFRINNKKNKPEEDASLKLARYPFDVELVLVLVVSFIDRKSVV